MVSLLDVQRARKAYYQGDVTLAQALVCDAPADLARLLDTRALDGEPSWDTHNRRTMFLTALRTIDPTPALSEVLLPLALGTSREERDVAQAVLSRGEPPLATLRASLSDGAKDTRLHAAEWLAKLRAKEAIPALVTAFRKEKVEFVRASLLRALVGLGEPIGRFLDRAELAKDAKKVLSKGVPQTLAFLSTDTLPRVRWKDGGEVPAEVVTAWIVSAHKGKTPIASPLLTAYAAEMIEREREALGEAIFDRWLDEDFRLPEPLDADVRDRISTWAQAAGMSFEAYARTPTFKLNAGALTWMMGKSVETGALDHRGVLAVAAALAPRALVPRCAKYVRDFRGIRIGSSRAMLHMLAGMEDRAATQALVRFSMRFRTASLRKEAERLVNELAARRGWSSDELADRMIPTAGLDDQARMRLTFVEARAEVVTKEDDDDEESTGAITRVFEARLDDELDLSLFVIDAGVASLISKLPEPRKDEDAAHAAAEKKRLSASKKEIKALVTAQRDRLFESMCSERAMPLADFRGVYLSHPIMRVLLARVVLLARDAEGAILGACRVSEDGTFVTADNDTLRLPDDATITIAHGSSLSDAEERRFADHLAEYELASLFPQLGRARHALDPSQPGLLRLVPDDVSVSSFALRGRMKRLGWERGPSGDGGWVDRYARPFTSLRLEAVLVHTAVPQPETDTPIAIEGIEVHRLPPPDAPLHAPRSVLLVSAIPAVLRHELRNDLLAATAI